MGVEYGEEKIAKCGKKAERIKKFCISYGWMCCNESACLLYCGWLLNENWIEKQKKKRDRNAPIACWCFTLNNFGYEGGTARP